MFNEGSFMELFLHGFIVFLRLLVFHGFRDEVIKILQPKP